MERSTDASQASQASPASPASTEASPASPASTEASPASPASTEASPASPASPEASAASTASLPVGRSGRIEAMALTAAGDHALLVRETGADHRARALLTTDKLAAGERLVVMPLDEDVEVRVDGDALAVWLGSGSVADVPREQRPMPTTPVPIWASLIGGALLLLVLAFAVIGSAVTFTWLTRLLT